jgi:SAM-dependent methyltransferase
MLKKKVEIIDFIYRLKEFTELLSAGWYTESEANKLTRVVELLLSLGNQGRILQIMAYPYFLSAAIRRFSLFELDVTFHRDRNLSPLCTFNHEIHALDGETFPFNPLTFDLEKDIIPLPDAFFDGIIFYDVLEHLPENPAFVCAEIHRVLAPDGFLIITTPNVHRLDNLVRLFRGENIFAPYDGFGAWGRAVREYTPVEVTELLEAHNFTIESFFVEDITPRDHAHWRTYKSLNELITMLFPPEEPREMREHIFALARASGRRQYALPERLFEKLSFEECNRRIGTSLVAGLASGNDFIPHTVVTHFSWLLNFVTAGFNDHLQLGHGWYNPEMAKFPFCWMTERGEVFLRNDCEKRILSLEFRYPFVEVRPRFPELSVGNSQIPHLQEIVSLEEGWYRIFFELPPMDLPVMRITISSPKTIVPQQIDKKSQDTRSLGLALRHIGTFQGNRVTMNQNDGLFLGAGWEDVEYWPPFVRWIGKKAALRLYPLGGEKLLSLRYYAPLDLCSPVDLSITIGNNRIVRSLNPDSTWQTACINLSEPLYKEIPITLELSRTWSPSRDSIEKSSDARELSIALSSIMLGLS